MKKPAKVLFFLVIVLGIGYGLTKNYQPPRTAIKNNLDIQKNQENLDVNPFTIAALSKRKYETRINIENKIRETNRFVSYKISYSSDGLKLFALMNVPLGNPPTRGWPIVMVNHGYIPPEQYSTENSYINTSAYFANAGFLVLKPDYRGHDNSDGEAGSLVSRINYAVDVLNLMAGIDQIEKANENKIYLFGHSMGGDISLRILEVSDKISAASLWAPAVHTFPEGFLYFARRNPTPSDRMERYQRELEELFPEEIYDQVDPLLHLDRVKVPIIIQHATTDESVPYEWGTTLEKKLLEADKSVRLFTYPNDNHDLAGNWSTALNRDIEFFRAYLK